MNGKQDLTLDSLGTGLMCGLVETHAPIRGWRFHDSYAHGAIRELYLHLQDQENLNLQFAIFLDRMSSRSYDWDGQVDRLMMQRWLSQSIPDGEFTIHASPSLCAIWLEGEHARLPGGKELWLECAHRFQLSYDVGLRAVRN